MKRNNLVDFSFFASHVSFKEVKKHRGVGLEIFSEEFFEI